MLIDTRQIPEGAVIKTGICILGAGVAGIVLAREFAGSSQEVTLLESGGFEFDEKTQSLYQGEDAGLPYFSIPESTRLRYFGGSSNHWEGWCRPLERESFVERDWVPHGAWPISYDTLVPYYPKAQTLCQLGPFEYDAEYWTGTEKILPFSKEKIRSVAYQLSPPTRFGKVYRDDITAAPNICLYLWSNVLEIVPSENRQEIQKIRAVSFGKEFTVEAKVFVLAMGGIENARMLLMSRSVQKEGLANENDSVGRYFMDHPHMYSALVFPTGLTNFDIDFYANLTKKDGGAARGALTLPAETKARERLLGLDAVLSVYAVEQVPESVASASLLLGGAAGKDFGAHVRNVVRDIDAVWKHAAAKLRKKELNYDREILAMGVRAEQSPNPESRVVLDYEKKDFLGQPCVKLNWQLHQRDVDSIVRSCVLMGREFGAAGLGRFMMMVSRDLKEWLPMLKMGKHHMGTTRMSADPKQGVVDAGCKVHGISNFFIAGSSVFSTSGGSNPTLTIVALTLRLAEHLKAWK